MIFRPWSYHELYKKPDIVAPGLNIISCNNIINRSFYIPRSGTSMSTPIVSGCIALLLQKYPYFTNKDVKLQLKRTAIDLHMPHENRAGGLFVVIHFKLVPDTIIYKISKLFIFATNSLLIFNNFYLFF